LLLHLATFELSRRTPKGYAYHTLRTTALVYGSINRLRSKTHRPIQGMYVHTYYNLNEGIRCFSQSVPENVVMQFYSSICYLWFFSLRSKYCYIILKSINAVVGQTLRKLYEQQKKYCLHNTKLYCTTTHWTSQTIVGRAYSIILAANLSDVHLLHFSIASDVPIFRNLTCPPRPGIANLWHACHLVTREHDFGGTPHEHINILFLQVLHLIWCMV
jgi:hypothetical protein